MENNFSKSKHTHHHGGKIAYLESAARKAELSLERLMDIIPLKKADQILDFGAGTGYFTLPFAKKVEGMVYALDIDQTMLEMIRSKAEQEHITNIQLIRGGSDSIPLPDASIDVIMASLVLHEVNPLEKTLQQFMNVLKRNGHLICIELEPKQASERAPRITCAKMEEKLVKSGMQIIEKKFLTEFLYILIAKKQ
ncbi:class I SAM-dependent methyltransferase [Planococcus sp. NCCP-2050]|uniref:class I SAM-dependent methyltransferase n=1 Tax=Planococcus sp. NCCP-2050 TaxID=2944679 RepID=UPI002040F2AF|nr:class I SAM-dependent methyltransferase [Planococcus sp. NCCP-2050]GKW44713.1 SAM-dependent methyltransferase [Planococcus sp. NCCP-2050]